MMIAFELNFYDYISSSLSFFAYFSQSSGPASSQASSKLDYNVIRFFPNLVYIFFMALNQIWMDGCLFGWLDGASERSNGLGKWAFYRSHCETLWQIWMASLNTAQWE